MIELVIGALIGMAFGAAHGWPSGAGAIAGAIVVGIPVYFASCLWWQEWRCWYPFCTAKRQTQAGPGKRLRRRRRCRVCGGSGTRLRWGTRMMHRA